MRDQQVNKWQSNTQNTSKSVNFFFKLCGGKGIAPFGKGVDTPMIDVKQIKLIPDIKQIEIDV